MSITIISEVGTQTYVYNYDREMDIQIADNYVNLKIDGMDVITNPKGIIVVGEYDDEPVTREWASKVHEPQDFANILKGLSSIFSYKIIV